MGSVPTKITIEAMQLFTVEHPSPTEAGNTIAYLQYDGIVRIGETNQITFDMGGIIDNAVIEFTIVDKFHYIVRNGNGVARDVYIQSPTNIIYGEIHTNVIKVAGGGMMKHNGYSFMTVENNGNITYLPIGSGGEIDIIPTSDGIKNIYPSVDDSNIIKVQKTLTLKRGGDLINNISNEIITTGVTDFGEFSQDGVKGLAMGNYVNAENDTEWDSTVRSKAKFIFSEVGHVQNSFNDAYDNFVANSNLHPACMWVGVGESNTHTVTHGQCISVTTAGSQNNINKSDVLYCKEDGKIYNIAGVEQIVTNRDAEGFNTMYQDSIGDKFIIFGANKQGFENGEIDIKSKKIFRKA